MKLTELFKLGVYSVSQAEKDRLLFREISAKCVRATQLCSKYEKFVEDAHWSSLSDIPPLPVTMFKEFDLRCISDESVSRILYSSSTTSQQPSKIYLDKQSALTQSMALVRVLAEHIGRSRRPLIIVDSEAMARGDSLTARGAGIRGLMNFASDHLFLLDDSMNIRAEALAQFIKKHHSSSFIFFGFTFIIWMHFLQSDYAQDVIKSSRNLGLSDSFVLHSGGWKKLTDQAVSSDVFSAKLSELIGVKVDRVLNFYGMAEQIGTVFVDCSAGYKHAPVFADVIIRKPGLMTEADIGETGIIEVVSLLPDSYPGNALLTEDLGRVIGVDNCTCGRSGKYFEFVSRAERAEVRGCGDTYGS